MRKLCCYLLYLGISTIILMEVFMRLWGYSEMYLYDPIYMPAENSEIPYILKPNLKNAKSRSNTRINTDKLGLRSLNSRDYSRIKKDKEYRIAFFGDSCTFGTGVANDKVFPEIIEHKLNRLQSNYAVDKFNFAVEAYNVKTMVDSLQYRGLSIAPDLVIMCIIYQDLDLNRTGTVDEYGYTANRKTSEYIEKTSIIKLLLRNIHLSYILRDLFIFKNHKVNSNEGAFAVKIPDSYKYILNFRDIALSNGMKYLIVLLPSVWPGDHNISEIIKQLDKDRITYYDLMFLAQSMDKKDYQVSKWDPHPSALVHRRIGELLSNYILVNYLK